MEHHLPHTISLLARTPAALDALLRDLPEAWTVGNEGGNTWSAFHVVGHLIHAERIVAATSERLKGRRWGSYWMNLLACAQTT